MLQAGIQEVRNAWMPAFAGMTPLFHESRISSFHKKAPLSKESGAFQRLQFLHCVSITFPLYVHNVSTASSYRHHTLRDDRFTQVDSLGVASTHTHNNSNRDLRNAERFGNRGTLGVALVLFPPRSEE